MEKHRWNKKRGNTMTREEVSRQYHIPVEILREYESWGWCSIIKKVMDTHQYDDWDLKNLSMIMTLYDIGFCVDEVEHYMRLLLEKENTEIERIQILNKKRSAVLDEIHSCEKRLDRLDYLRYEICKDTNTKN